MAASHRVGVTYLAEQRRGSSSSSQAGDENASPRIPLLHLTGWVPGDVGFSTSMVCLPPQAGLGSCASPRPAQPPPVSRREFSTGAARLYSCTTFPKPGLQSEFLRSSGRLILGMLIIIGLLVALLKTLVQTFRPDLQTGQPGVPESGQYQNQ